MIQFVQFWFVKKNKQVYRQVAEENHVSLWHVYQLANGKPSKSTKDYCILLRLREHKLVDHVMYHG